MSVGVGEPLRIGPHTVRNRLYRAPVLEGAGDGDDAVERYARHFVENARHGVGFIVQGSSCIFPEGRTSPGMTCVDTKEKMLRFTPMVADVHAAGASIFCQLGHGGIYAMEAWHEPYASQRQGPILAASPVPWFLRPSFRGVPVQVMTTDDVRAMATRYGEVAAWAREAGYDGIQLGSVNAKLLDQFLSPFYNRRTDEFGGSAENRARVLRLIRTAVAERAGADYPCLVKVPVEVAPFRLPHATFDEALQLARWVEDWGYDAVTPVEVSVFPDTTLSRGDAPDSFRTNTAMVRRLETAAPSRIRRMNLELGLRFGARRAPFRPVWNRALFAAVHRLLAIPVFAVGGIRTADDAASILAADQADAVGIGRPFYAEPDLAARILDGDNAAGLCENSNRCVPAQMLGMPGACYNPRVNKAARRGQARLSRPTLVVMATVRQFQVTFDCADPQRVAGFWCEVLGYVVPPPPEGFASWEDFDRTLPEEYHGKAYACVDPTGVGPRLFFQRVPEGKVVKNRVHLDVRAGRQGAARDARGGVRATASARCIAGGAPPRRRCQRVVPGDAGRRGQRVLSRLNDVSRAAA